MAQLEVVEKFISINGEGMRAGQPAAFIRFRGCNLHCGYCDTRWANGSDCPCDIMTEDEIFDYITESGVRCVTLTGGEPVLQSGTAALCRRLMEAPQLRIEIETNGSVSLSELNILRGESGSLCFTMDYKLPSSGMEGFMNTDNMELLREYDTVKFVCGSTDDLERAAEIIKKYDLDKRCGTLFSPVFGAIEPVTIVNFMLERRLMSARFQLQIHKYVWDPQKRGV